MVLTAAAIAAEAVTVLAHLLSKGGEAAAGEAGKGLFGWIKDKLAGKGKAAQLTELAATPDNPKLQGKMEGALEDILKENPALLEELHALLEKNKSQGGITITHSKNVVTGTIHAGGSVRIGDNITHHK